MLALYPYAVPALVGTMALNWAFDGIFTLICIVVCWPLLALGTVRFCRKDGDAWAMAKASMWVKIAQIPAYLFIFVLGFFLALPGFTLVFDA